MMIIDLHRIVLRQSVKGGNLNTQHSLVLQQSLVFFQSEIQFKIILKTTVIASRVPQNETDWCLTSRRSIMNSA